MRCVPPDAYTITGNPVFMSSPHDLVKLSVARRTMKITWNAQGMYGIHAASPQ